MKAGPETTKAPQLVLDVRTVRSQNEVKERKRFRTILLRGINGAELFTYPLF
jgi:hypothetical protein